MTIILAKAIALVAALAGLDGIQADDGDQAAVAKVVREAHTTNWSDTTQVVIQAHVPGPAMWKLTQGTSTVWVLGVLEQTPQDLTWDTRRLRRTLSGAHALILPGHTTVSPEALRQWDNYSRRPPAQQLPNDIPVSAENRIDRLVRTEPGIYGMDRRFKRVRLGVEMHIVVRDNHHIAAYQLVKDVEALPETIGIPETVAFNLSGDDLARGLQKLSVAGEDACLDDYLDDIDWDIKVLPSVARAWATGDILALEKDYRSPPGLVCNLLVPGWKEQYEAYNVSAMTHTLEGALAKPGKSVALVPLGDLLRKGGVLDRLQSEGVVITSPPSDAPSGDAPSPTDAPK